MHRSFVDHSLIILRPVNKHTHATHTRTHADAYVYCIARGSYTNFVTYNRKISLVTKLSYQTIYYSETTIYNNRIYTMKMAWHLANKNKIVGLELRIESIAIKRACKHKQLYTCFENSVGVCAQESARGVVGFGIPLLHRYKRWLNFNFDDARSE